MTYPMICYKIILRNYIECNLTGSKNNQENKKLEAINFEFFYLLKYQKNYLINFLYLILFGIKSPPKRFFLFSSYSEKPPSKK